MISTIKPDLTNTPKPEATPRAVTITCAEAHDGRLPVVVTVVPVADLEVTGVFVDYRKGSMPDDAIHVGGERVGTIKQGDAAVAALAAREVSDAAAAPAAPAPKPVAPTTEIAPEEKTTQVKAMPEAEVKAAKAPAAKQPVVSHQIAPGVKLTVGQAETFRADVALPEAPGEGETWFARGRFATNGGNDLSSAWTRI